MKHKEYDYKNTSLMFYACHLFTFSIETPLGLFGKQTLNVLGTFLTFYCNIPINLFKIFPTKGNDIINLINSCCLYNPSGDHFSNNIGKKQQ